MHDIPYVVPTYAEGRYKGVEVLRSGFVVTQESELLLANELLELAEDIIDMVRCATLPQVTPDFVDPRELRALIKRWDGLVPEDLHDPPSIGDMYSTEPVVGVDNVGG